MSFIRQLTAFISQNHNNETEDGDELAITVTMEQNHLSDDFTTSLQYFLDDCLNEKLRRLCAGLFAIYFDNISKVREITTLARKTIRRGKKELLQRLKINAVNHRIRKPGAGRKSKIKIHQKRVLEFVEEYTAGDPMSRKKWMRITLRKVSDELDHILSHVSVGKILKDHDYSLLVNKKTKRTRNRHPKRGVQLDFINAALKRFQTDHIPVFAIDGKKTEDIGPFKQYGEVWSTKEQQFEVYDHDYSSLAEGKLIPYGIYDYQQNEGYIIAGVSLETTEFAIDCLVIWWQNRGRKLYPEVSEIALTCDAGKPNSYRGNLFKYLLQTKFVDKFGITVHVMHYPPGDSKYHIIERALFSQISLKFRGNPLFTYDKAIALIRNTTTNAGLQVRAILHDQQYQRGIADSFSDTDYKTINISPADKNPEFNYAIRPRIESDTQRIRINGECKKIDKAIWHFSNEPYDELEIGVKRARRFVKESEWQHHSLVNIMYVNDPIRADGEVGRPPKGCDMIDKFYVYIDFEVLTSKKQLHKTCRRKYSEVPSDAKIWLGN